MGINGVDCWNENFVIYLVFFFLQILTLWW